MTKSILKLTMAPLVSLFIFVLGSGLFTTLLVVKLHHAGAGALFIGAITGVYYAGLAYGSFRIERYIIRVGHIRSFAIFASCLAVVSFLQGVLLNPIVWLLLRFIGGFATAGVFIVVESWLISAGNSKIRGQVLAFYMVSLYAAQALGQLLINLGDPNTLLLFAITAMLCSLSVIPISLTRSCSPEISEPSSLSFKALFAVSGSGMVGSFCSGLILGSIYGLLPLVIMKKTGDAADVGLLMSLVILGGMVLQYPVGRLSDYIERRLILLALSVLVILVSGVLMYFFKSYSVVYVALFVFGGLAFTLYPISISHACDALDQGDIVSGTQGVLLAYSVGAALGPFIAPIFIGLVGSNGLFFYVMVVCSLLAIFLIWRKAIIPATPQEENFIAMPQTTPVMAEMDPRGEMPDVDLNS